MPIEVQATSINDYHIHHSDFNSVRAMPFQAEIRDKAEKNMRKFNTKGWKKQDKEALSHGNYIGVGNKNVFRKIASETVHDALLHQSMAISTSMKTESKLLRDDFVSEATTSAEVKG